MPSVSKAQRTAMAIAEHHPEKLYARNRGLLSMSKSQLHDYASTPGKGLPEHKGEGVFARAAFKRRSKRKRRG